MAKGGKQPGAGRPKGSQSKANKMIEDILETMNCDPLRILAEIAKGERVHCTTYLDKEQGEHVEEEIVPSLDQRKDACKELLGYIYPKRKAVEHSTDPDKPLQTKIEVTFRGSGNRAAE